MGCVNQVLEGESARVSLDFTLLQRELQREEVFTLPLPVEVPR